VEPIGGADRRLERMGAGESGKVFVAVLKVWNPMLEVFC